MPDLINFNGKRVYIIGDSHCVAQLGSTLSHWILTEGHASAVEVDAIGGFAISYFGDQLKSTNSYKLKALLIIARAFAFAPDIVVVVLGTNDYAQASKNVFSGARRLLKEFGSKLYIVGPPAFRTSLRENAPNEGAARVVQAEKSAVGSGHFLDSRPLTEDMVNPPLRRAEGIHFAPKGYAAWGGRIFFALSQGKGPGQVNKKQGVDILTTVGLIWGGYELAKVLMKAFKKKGR